MGYKSYTELRAELAAAQRKFLETDLAIAATFAEMATRHCKEGDSQHGDRCIGQAEKAIKTVRHFIATTDLLAGAEGHVLARRCDQLERTLSRLKRG
jgi:hypothetical protein